MIDIKSEELDRVDKYLQENFNVSFDKLSKFDDLIWDCVISSRYAKDNLKQVDQCILELQNLFITEILVNKSIVPNAVAIQERLYQLKVIKDKVTDNDDTRNLTLLSFAGSFDTSWLKHSPK